MTSSPRSLVRLRRVVLAAVAGGWVCPLQAACHAAPPPVTAPAEAPPDVPSPDAAAGAVQYEPDLRPAVFINFSPRGPSPQNPYGYQRHWQNQETAEQYLRSQLARGDRIIIRTPFGDGVEGWVTSKQWQVAEPWRRELFIRVINEWLAENPKRTFSLYIGTLVGDPSDRSMTGARSPTPDDGGTMRDFLATVRPWLEATKIHRLWLDHSASPPGNRSNVLKLARWCRENLDLVVGMEAWPRTGADLDAEVMRQVPTLATWRFPESFDKQRAWTVPPGCEAHLIVIPQPRSPKPTLDALRDYRRRGFIIGSGHHEYDRMTQQVNAEPVPAPPG